MSDSATTPAPATDVALDDHERHRSLARSYLSPRTQAALTLKDYERGLGDLELLALIEELQDRVEAVQSGDLGRAEEMLMMQAHTLDRLFNSLLQDAASSERAYLLELRLKLGLRAQSQCRATLEALATMKGPRSATFVGQNNFAAVQQVNNGTAEPPPESRRETVKSRVLESDDEQRLDPGASSPSGATDSRMATVAPFDRAEVGSG